MKNTREGVDFYPNTNLSPETNAEIRQQIEDMLQQEVDQLDETSSPLPEELNQFADRLKVWMLENWFRPAGIKDEEVILPAFIRDRYIPQTAVNTVTFGESPTPSRGVYLDMTIFLINYDDPDILNYMAARTILEEMYHKTSTDKLRIMLDPEPQEPGMESVVVEAERSGLSFSRKGEDFSTIEEGLAQLFARKAEKFLQEQFPVGYQKIEQLRTPEFAHAYLLRHKNGQQSWGVIHEGAEYLVSEIVSHSLNGDVSLLERSRIKGEDLVLARQLKKTYGTDVYKKIMTVPENKADQLAFELSQL